jgi:hypothetical protein
MVRLRDIGPLVGTLLKDRNEESIAVDAERDQLRPCVDRCWLEGFVNTDVQGRT